MAQVGAGRLPKALRDPAPLTTARTAPRGQAHGQNKETERPVLGRAPLCGQGEGEPRLPRWALPSGLDPASPPGGMDHGHSRPEAGPAPCLQGPGCGAQGWVCSVARPRPRLPWDGAAAPCLLCSGEGPGCGLGLVMALLASDQGLCCCAPPRTRYQAPQASVRALLLQPADQTPGPALGVHALFWSPTLLRALGATVAPSPERHTAAGSSWRCPPRETDCPAAPQDQPLLWFYILAQAPLGVHTSVGGSGHTTRGACGCGHPCPGALAGSRGAAERREGATQPPRSRQPQAWTWAGLGALP